MNPFNKFLKGEDNLHIACCQYLKLQYPQAFFIHVPNEGRRTPFERFKAKLLGITAGIPDILIFSPSKQWYGFGIELKYAKNSCTDNQKRCQEALSLVGWRVDTFWEFEAFKHALNDYFGDGNK